MLGIFEALEKYILSIYKYMIRGERPVFQALFLNLRNLKHEPLKESLDFKSPGEMVLLTIEGKLI